MRVFQIFLVVICLVILTNSQDSSEPSEKSTLSGKIIDEFGMVMPYGKVTFVDKNGRSVETLTGTDGTFRIELVGGKYRIEVNGVGFETYKTENYKVANKAKMEIDFSLDVKAIVDYATLSPEKQTTTTSILSGKVYDAVGSVVAGAKVTATNLDSKKFETVTNEEGLFKLTLPFNKYGSIDYKRFGEAKYDVVVESRGFKRWEQKGFVFIPSQFGKMQLDIGLELGRILD